MPSEPGYSDTTERTDAETAASSESAPNRAGAIERETLVAQVAGLESEVEELEATVDSLERAVARKERRREQVIDNYETVIAEKERAHRARQEELEATSGGVSTGATPSLRTRVGEVVTRLRRFLRE